MAIVKTKKADLNIHHKKYFQISMIIVLTLLIAAFKFSPNVKKAEKIKDADPTILKVEIFPGQSRIKNHHYPKTNAACNY